MEDKRKNKEKFLNCFRPVQGHSYNDKYSDCNTNIKYRSSWNKTFRKFNHTNSSYYGREKGWQEKDREKRGGGSSLNDIFTNSFPVYQKSNKTSYRSNSKDIYAWSDQGKESSRKHDSSDVPIKLLKKLRTRSVQKNGRQSLSQINHSEMDNLLQENVKHFFKQVDDEFYDKRISESKKDSNFIEQVKCKERENVYGKELQKSQTSNIQLLNKAQISLTSEGNKFKCTPNMTSDYSMTIRNKQKKIQQNLISELMTMPRENLKKIISDPKIYPKFEIGMEQLVNESRLLLAQKFRNLAESKMCCEGQILQSQLVNDMGNLIDPDLAVDVCQLPPELIKQIGDIFQLDFEENLPMNDYKNNNITEEKTDKQNMECYEHDNFNELLENRLQDTTDALELSQNIISSSANAKENVDNSNLSSNSELQNHINSKCEKFLELDLHKANSSEVYIKAESHSEPDCTHLDKKNDKKRFMDSHRSFISKRRRSKSNFNKCSFTDCRKTNSDNNCYVNTNINNFYEKSSEMLDKDKKILDLKFVQVNQGSSKARCTNLGFSSCSKTINNVSIHNTCCPFQSDLVDNYSSLKSEINCSQNKKNSYSGINKTFSIFETEKDVKLNNIAVNDDSTIEEIKYTFKMYDNECKGKSAGAQTNISLIEVRNQEIFSHSNDTEETLLMEINEIDNFVHRLNQKKFLLFLKLLGLSNCSPKLNAWRISLLHNVTNGDMELLNKLNKNLNIESKEKEKCEDF